VEAGGWTLVSVLLSMHGHALVGFETLRTQIGDEEFYVTLYRDASGQIAYVELTN
jgi:hypothetical protein